MSAVQGDDGSRNALKEFMRERDKNVSNIISFCISNDEYWKGRVFLELVWEYESRLKPSQRKKKGTL